MSQKRRGLAAKKNGRTPHKKQSPSMGAQSKAQSSRRASSAQESRPQGGRSRRSASSVRAASPSASPKATPRRGRPTGTTALTREVEEAILAYIRGGGFRHVAAESAGISARTFRDWMARGEGTHPTRKPTPALRRFAAKVNTAEGQARLSAETRAHQEYPKFWLTHAARTKGDREGWTEPAKGSSLGERGGLATSDEAVRAELERLLRELLASGELRIPRCSHARCRCPHHRMSKRPTTQKERKR